MKTLQLGQIEIILSDVADGTRERDDKPAVETFLRKLTIEPDHALRVRMGYERNDFARYTIVDDKLAGRLLNDDNPVHDALTTQTPGLTLFLPLADCIGAVLYDPEHKAIMVSHLGRHNTEQFGAIKSVEFMQASFQTDPSKLLVWLSPAAGKQNYPLFAFDHRSLHEVNAEHLQQAGVSPANIQVDNRDTTADPSFFSHSEFLKGNRPTDGRFIIAATLSI